MIVVILCVEPLLNGGRKGDAQSLVISFGDIWVAKLLNLKIHLSLSCLLNYL